MEELTETVVPSGRSYADVKLIGAVLNCNHLLHEPPNADVREASFGLNAEATERRRQSASVGRMLKRLYVRGLIAKVPRSRRWRVTEKGRQVLGAAVRLYYHGTPARLCTPSRFIRIRPRDLSKPCAVGAQKLRSQTLNSFARFWDV
jgi:DNA-binding MarR family transcriptional regulator